METASHLVRRWAEREPGTVCLHVHAGSGPGQTLTYAALHRAAAAHARLYRRRGLRPGDPIVLVARTAPAFVAALLGAQDAGLLAVPCPPPEPLETPRRVAERIGEVLARSGAAAMYDPRPGSADAGLASVAAGRLLLEPPDAAEPDDPAEEPTPGSFAYCQFTSGSGGRAKGVLLTHDNVLANIRAMEEAFGFSREDVCVSWLPLFHDMGLVGYLLMPLILGAPIHLMTPAGFIANPASWLQLISRVRGTVSTGPNFAYALCARKVGDADLSTLDLSTWRVACSGSEPVSRDVVDAFARRFAPCGFRRAALLPCYGLAEDTLCVSSRRPGTGPAFEELSREALGLDGTARPEAGGAVIASVGAPIPGHEVAILDGRGEPLPDRRVGEIAVRGASVMHGYLPGTTGEVALGRAGWLLTGDLGYLAGGELYVVGRKKDVIIRAGRNYYPQDLEDAALTVAGVRAGRAVAFSIVSADGETVVLLVERRREWTGDDVAMRQALRDAVFGAVRFAPDRIEILAQNTLPLTSSGKAIRPEARRLYEQGAWAAGPAR